MITFSGLEFDLAAPRTGRREPITSADHLRSLALLGATAGDFNVVENLRVAAMKRST
jgi:hypothetical protein